VVHFAQLYPSLVENGQNTASVAVNTDTTWRAALGQLASGPMFFAVGNMNMNAFAQALIGLGARHAGYTDGGGSGHLRVYMCVCVCGWVWVCVCVCVCVSGVISPFAVSIILVSLQVGSD